MLIVPAGCAPRTALAGPPDPARYADLLVGAFVPSGFWHDLAEFRALETRVGGEFDVGHWFTPWPDAYDPVPVNDLLERGRIPLISWQAHGAGVAEIRDGEHDDYVRAWARGAAQAQGVVYLRPFPEMNGEWTAWYGDPAALVGAWRRIVSLFREEGAHNVRWVWSPNVTDEPNVAANRMELYYPGSEYVDVLALDGYNWGNTREYIGWRSFETVFRQGYERVAALGPQPVWFAEVASTEHGGDKAKWINEMLTTTAFERLEAIIWFNEDKETDWRMESSRASVEAFRAWFEWREAEAARTQAADDARATAPAHPSSKLVAAGRYPDAEARGTQ